MTFNEYVPAPFFRRRCQSSGDDRQFDDGESRAKRAHSGPNSCGKRRALAPAGGSTMHTCSKCRRTLSNATRDALCLRCLYAIDRGGAFAVEEETKPGRRPLSLAAAAAGAEAAA